MWIGDHMEHDCNVREYWIGTFYNAFSKLDLLYFGINSIAPTTTSLSSQMELLVWCSELSHWIHGGIQRVHWRRNGACWFSCTKFPEGAPLQEAFQSEEELMIIKGQMQYIRDKSALFVDATNLFQSQSPMAMSVSVKTSFNFNRSCKDIAVCCKRIPVWCFRVNQELSGFCVFF